MANQNWNFENEQNFEALLTESLPEMAPKDIVQEVTPWKKATNRVLMGMALCVLRFNFYCLDYILPTIGVFLLFLGYRALREENKWFKDCWILILIRMSYYLPFLVLNATIYQSASFASQLVYVANMVSIVLTLLECFFLWKGFREIQRKAGLPARANAAIAMLIWYGIACLLAYVQYVGIVIALFMVLAYILMLRSLYKLSKELDEAGYLVQMSTVRVADRTIVSAITGILTVGIVCGYLFFQKYPMDWEVLGFQAESANFTKAEKIKEHLVELGVPANVLKDLKEEDILACEGALRVYVSHNDFPVNEGRWETKETYNGTEHYQVFDEKELRLTGVAIELPGEREQWKLIHHFQWTIHPGFCGTESIQLWPTTRLEEGWRGDEKFTGQILYDDKETYVSSYESLKIQTYTSNDWFMGEQTRQDVFASFSFPNKGENHRGYISYTVKEVQDGTIIDSWINYTHQQHLFQYPVMTAEKNRMAGSWNESGAFKLVQDALQFFPTKEELESF